MGRRRGGNKSLSPSSQKDSSANGFPVADARITASVASDASDASASSASSVDATAGLDNEKVVVAEERTESSNLEDPPEAEALVGSDKTSADYYFDSYSHFGIHEEMLKDVVRTKTYQNVIYQNTFIFKNKVVLDVGAGTGILSLFCAKAGAKHVYAVECSLMADMAKEIVQANGFSNVITVLTGKLEEIELPITHVDIIISEWMGYFLLFENMLNTVLYARDKWLISGGIILPDKTSLYLTAIEDAEYKEDKIEFWNNVYGFDMSCIKKQAMMEPLVDTVSQDQIVTNCQLLKTLDISKMAAGDVSFTVPFKLVARRNDFIHALVAYFDVSFTKCHKLMGFSTGYYSLLSIVFTFFQKTGEVIKKHCLLSVCYLSLKILRAGYSAMVRLPRYSCQGRILCYIGLRLYYHRVRSRKSFTHLEILFIIGFGDTKKLPVLAGPRSKATHWKQTVLYLDNVLTICEGEALVGSMSVEPNKKNPRDIEIMLQYSLNGKRCQISRTQHYKMR